MTTPRYTQLRGLASTAEIRTARYDEREFIVIPVAAMVGGAVVRPLDSEGPEYVPPEVLAVAPGQWANRPVLADHPENGTASANSPKVLEAERYGWTFNSEFRGGKLWMEAWLDPARAAQIGGDAQRVVESARRALAGEDVDPIEVSIGAWVVLAEEAGTAPNGKSYAYRWLDAYSDHLAVGLNGSPGACGVKDGCGAIRSNQEEEDETPRKALMRAAIRSQARRPTYSGTETAAWSNPTFADYVRYLFQGSGGPTTVSQASSALKREIAAHTLLGDPEATTFRELSFFPVVNPSTGKLNERALRAVISGRGSQADIPDRAKQSAQDMARRLLNSEYDADLEVNMSDTEKQGKARAAAESENLMGWLRDALMQVEAGFDHLWVESFDDEAGTVVYMLVSDEGPNRTFQRSYELDVETVTIGEERTPVRRRVVYEEAPEMTAAKLDMPAPLVKVLNAMGFRSAQDEGTSDVEMRERMEKALRSAVPAYQGIAEIFHETKTVIYATHPDEEMLWWRRTFTTGDEGEITLNDDEEQVEIEQSWVSVQARLQFDAAEEDCGCKPQPGDGQGAPNQPDDEGENMSKATNAKSVEELVGRLIANEASPFDDSDKEHLSALSEEKLKAMEAKFQADETEGEESEAEAPAKAEAAKPTKAGAAEEAPKEEPEKSEAEQGAEVKPEAETVQLKKDEHERLIRAAEAWEAEETRRQAEEARRKGELVASLKAAQEVFDEDDLKALSLAQLEKLARTHELAEEASAPDYSGRGAANAGEGERKAPPKPWSMALAKQRGDNAGKEATN